MRIGERHFGDAVVLDVAGAIVGDKARTAIDEAVRRFGRTGTRTLVVNLSAVPSMDLAGLSTLVDACRRIQVAGGVLRLACVTRRIGDLLVITRLLTVFDTFDSVEDAVGVRTSVDADKPDAPKAPVMLLETIHRFLRRA